MEPSDTPPEKPDATKPPPFEPGDLSKDSCTMGMLAHLLGALFGFLGPLIIWLVKKDADPFVDDQGKEALNFQITILFGLLAAGLLTGVSCGFLFPVMGVPPLLSLIFGIMGCLEANKGIAYRYPFAIRLIK